MFRNRVNREIKNLKLIIKTVRVSFQWYQITQAITQLNINGKLVNNPDEIAEKVNEYFVNIGPQTDKCILKVPNVTQNKFLKNKNQYNFIVAHIDEGEIMDIIKALNNKSSGPCSIPLKLLLIISDIIIISLCHLIKMSLDTGTYPDKLILIINEIYVHKVGLVIWG